MIKIKFSQKEQGGSDMREHFETIKLIVQVITIILKYGPVIAKWIKVRMDIFGPKLKAFREEKSGGTPA